MKVDTGSQFDKIFDEFFDLLQHESPVVSPHIARVSGKIINAKPNLQNKIIELLLNTDKTTKCRHKELLKSYIIEGLDEAYNNITNKLNVIEFVKLQLKSESPKTREKAKLFLSKRLLSENN